MAQKSFNFKKSIFAAIIVAAVFLLFSSDYSRAASFKFLGGSFNLKKAFKFISSACPDTSASCSDFGSTDLVGLWHFNTNWNDYSSSGLTGTPYGNVDLISSGRLDGGAGGFDGNSGDYIQFGSNDVVIGESGMTVGAWVKWEGTANGLTQQTDISRQDAVYALMAGSGGSHSARFAIVLDSDDTFHDAGNGTTYIDDGEWHLIAGVYDGSECMTYVDGVKESYNNCSGNVGASFASATTMKLGGGASNYWNGSMDEFFLYKKALSPAEMSELYSSGCGKTICNQSFQCGTSTVSKDSVTYGTVVGEDGNCWLDKNLGASQVATAYNDSNAYGWYFQWGRLVDGHQISTSGTTSTLSSSDTPGHSNFIVATSSPYDWRNPQNGSLWQGLSGTNNPCPDGFRLPTSAEWSSYVSAASITNSATAYSSNLKLTVAGFRSNSNGSLIAQGTAGYYWSYSLLSTRSYFLAFQSSSVNPTNNTFRAAGNSVRCIKD